MLCRRARAVWTFALVLVLTLGATAQSVISTRSGVIHYFEGTVYLADQPLDPHPGIFRSIPPGTELRTAQGRAEVLLTPGVFLRIGEQSTIRMVANELADTRVELVTGSAIVDSADPVAGTSVTLIYQKWRMRFPEQGVYRIDSNPPRLWVVDGRADMSGDNARELTVGQGMCLPFAPVLVPDRSFIPPIDALSRWADGRQQSISADNAIAANIQDPASMVSSDPGVYGFTYFPPLWLTPSTLSLSSLYGSQGLFQPGFNSVYLPGYNYLPLIFGLAPVGSPPNRQPSHISGPYPITHIPVPYHGLVRPIMLPPIPVRPASVPPVMVRPVSPTSIPVHPASSGGIHPGVHR